MQAYVLFVKLLLFVCSFLEVLFTPGKDLQITAGVNHSFPKSSHLTQVQVSPTKLGRAKLNFKLMLTGLRAAEFYGFISQWWKDTDRDSWGIGRYFPPWQLT